MATIPEFLSPILLIFWQIFKNWWWVLPLFLLWSPFLYLYLWWRQECWDATVPRILLEIKIPKEILKPIKAMEYVFAGFHAIHDPPIWREKWIEGQYQLGFSLEIVSINGEVHFYIRTPARFRNLFESNIYAQYPEVEISEVPDYTKNVPQDIPNKDWDLSGMSVITVRPDPYPIKTYTKFESELQTKEEKRIDPLAELLEGMSSLKPGEQLWIQIIAKPIRDEKNWVKQGQKIRDKLVKRPEKPKQKPMIQELIEVLISGPSTSSEKKAELIPPEMKLTPGEREIVNAIEEKISKLGFDCHIRYIYLAKRDVFFAPRAAIPFGFFKQLSAENLNSFKPLKETKTKVKSVFFWFLDKRRLYLRKRRILRYYQKRLPPFFPRSGGTYVFNTEELATLYHFPSKMVVPAPAVPRIEAKRGEPPPGLPIE